ncbi:MAG: hypothetical protein AAGG51_28455 [Cyanobacteria bacterium P01_G01_bin.54]
MSQSSSEQRPLAALEAQLQHLSHSDDARSLIQQFAESLGKTKQRQRVFNQKGALLQAPIEYDDALQSGVISPQEDRFQLLQGDIVSTDAAYLLGDRLTGGKFAIASSTCDLVPQRRRYAALLRICPISSQETDAKAQLGQWLKFKSTQGMYLPPLSTDAPDVVGNVVNFDGIVQIHLADLLNATRHASLSLVGWRMFGSLLRSLIARTGVGEVDMRTQLSATSS